ncbi:L-lactate permease [Kushneria aurantia]|uniref:L-lactate permease n=1 Tax=Kushneria aurantia TaxID=504092 RepID=A0ABV6G1W1_9GAMM|nr:L-lactate permease [Kushneria aurantia]
MMELAAACTPLVLLIFLMGKKNSMASSRALPLCAMLAYLLALAVFDRDANAVNATVVSGLLMALTPLSIVAGAIFMFRTMEVTGALTTIRGALNGISHNPIAQLMIVGWAFAFLIEGASGFGTPAAIAAPVLVGLGFPALRVATFCLIMNTIPVTFGAVGTPIWFGFSVLDLSPAALRDIAWQSALINATAAPLVVVAGLAMVVRWREIVDNLVFILLATFSCTLPYVAISFYSVEFPSLIGGLVGLSLTLLLARRGVGLARVAQPQAPANAPGSGRALLKATFPLWGTVLILVVTRIPALGLKPLLQLDTPALQLPLGQLGELTVSAGLVVGLNEVFRTDIGWHHSILYVPALLPFVLVGLLTLGGFHRAGAARDVGRYTLVSIRAPFFALMGALVFVNLMMLGDEASPVALIGYQLARLSGEYWTVFAPLLGALGSFFSGSATISNLTFSAIQFSIAEQSGLSTSGTLALQGVGAAMGNMICINNIVAVTAILGLQRQDGVILKRTALVMLLYAAVAGAMGLLMSA